ncbi:MAG TPA: DUF5916 domain-containing protein [Bacteroidota bacterium]|nr:DUF5916 domain-containing protein [Bacteroidota bacterium]
MILARRLNETVVIDGRLIEAVWSVPGTRGFVQREPSEGAPATEDTEIWIAYDDDALYIAARMYDSKPDSIVGVLARRDENSESDKLSIGIDAAFDRRTAIYVSVNPAGAIEDGTLYNDSQLGTWDGVWDVGVNTDDLGWTAEFRIPYSQLRFTKQQRYVWGIEFVRRIQRKNEESYLTLHPRNDQVRVSRFAELHGIEGIEPPARIEILPYVVSTGKFLEQPPVHAFNMGRKDPFVIGRDYQATVGADAKIGLGGEMTLDATLNPDFAQVEVDPAVVNLTAYEVRFDEKRPFFVEGSNILKFGRGGATSLQDFGWSDPSFFYSRRVGRAPQGTVRHPGFQHVPDRTTILGAAKVSGKIDNTWSIAALSAVTDREYGEVDSAGVLFSDEIEPLTFYGVVRTQKEFDEARQAIGIIATGLQRDFNDERLRSIMNDRAVSGGIDGWVFLDREKDWVITGWAGMSSVAGSRSRMISLQRSPQHYFQRPDADHVEVDSNATSMTGWATRVWLDKVKGDFIFNAAFGAIHPKFDVNDAGFLNFADYINAHVYTGYQTFEPDELFRFKIFTVAAFREYNFGGFRTGETYRAAFEWQFPSFYGGYVSGGYSAETYDGQRTRGGPLMKALSSQFLSASLYSDVRKALRGTLTFTGATGTSGGWQYSYGLYVSWKASKTISLSVNPSVFVNHQVAQYITTVNDPIAQETFGRRYIFAVLDQTQVSASTRLNWTFAPRLSLQLYMQPLFSTGRYSDIKELALPRTFTFNHYERAPASLSFSNNRYTIDPDGSGPAQSFSITNPDFNFKSVRLNAVLRWEFSPGSVLYVAWTNQKVNVENVGDFRFGKDFRTLLRDRPDNVLSVKISYWWGM